MLERYLKYCSVLLLVVTSCFQETPVRVSADFEIEIVNDDYSVPATVRITNKTTGADLYAWFFEGGEPASSNKYNPEDILYSNAGKYLLRLEAWNTTERKIKELTIDLDSAIYANFTTQVKTNYFSPVVMNFINNSYGGSKYCWKFEGGEPSVFEGKNPPEILFTTPGEHHINLQVSNGREMVEFSDTLLVFPALSVDFVYHPGPDDLDMEAPILIQVASHCTSALSYHWKIQGGKIENDTLPETIIHIEAPGTYHIELYASNQKDTQKISREIKVLENTNLYKVHNLKFGITTASHTVGVFYSSATRNVLKTTELTSCDNSAIDFIFWSLPGFEQCCFISPDSSASKAFPDITKAKHTRIMNQTDFITNDLFDNMENDVILHQFEIVENNEKVYFNKEHVPHYVFFETEDKRKGVIKIKEFVEAGSDSYALADIKIQKESR